MTATMERLQKDHNAHVDRNRTAPIAEYPSRSPQVDRVFEVTDGVKHVPSADGKTQVPLGPGRRFRPTELAIASGALEGKARELTTSEMTGLRGGRVFAGAEIGVRKDLAEVPMAPSTLERALRSGLTPADFANVSPEGAEGNYTRAQIDAISAAKAR